MREGTAEPCDAAKFDQIGRYNGRMEIPDYGPCPDPPDDQHDDRPDDDDLLDRLGDDRPQQFPPREVAWYRHYSAVARYLASWPNNRRVTLGAIASAEADGMPQWMLIWLRDSPAALADDLDRAADEIEQQRLDPPDGSRSWAEHRFGRAADALRRDEIIVAPAWALDRWW